LRYLGIRVCGCRTWWLHVGRDYFIAAENAGAMNPMMGMRPNMQMPEA